MNERFAPAASACAWLLFACGQALADDTSAGPTGINSRGLNLTGAGIHIGQVELGRPGQWFLPPSEQFPNGVPLDSIGEWFWDYGADRMPNTNDAGEDNNIRDNTEPYVDVNGSLSFSAQFMNTHTDVFPYITNVRGVAPPQRAPKLRGAAPQLAMRVSLDLYLSDFYSQDDAQLNDHALGVAGVMIARGTTRRGVAPDAALHSGAGGVRGITEADGLVTAQEVVREAFDPDQGTRSDVRAVNHSWGMIAETAITDGSSLLTRGLDFFASKYDVLNVVGGFERLPVAGNPTGPQDQYNGITVSFLRAAPDSDPRFYDRYDDDNRYNATANGRITVELCAPGRQILVPRLILPVVENPDNYDFDSGTSFAAPHVTGAAALLHEFGNARRAAGTPRWDSSARRHEVMKAVLMNSADKLKDDGTRVPMGNLLGMEKTIYRNEAGTQTWLDSPAYAQFKTIPLDSRLGAGALNASRALTQYRPGEFDAGGMIPLIGWDHGITGQTGSIDSDYIFQFPLAANSFVSITLCWDRLVTLSGDDDIYNRGESFSTVGSGLTDLDLYLLRRAASGQFTIVANSLSSVDSSEHIFWKLTDGGDYMIRVRSGTADIDYGLAWWAVPTPGTAVLLTLGGLAVISSRRRRA